MKFQSITMNNFMRYKGQNVIEFSCDEKRNVTVVLGDNTVGKTTIAQAFRWVLYGAVLTERGKQQEDYQLLNNDILAMMDANSKADVTVELVAVDDEKRYRIKREIHYTRAYPQLIAKEFYKKVSLEISEKDDPNAGIATVYKGNIIKNLIMDCQSYTKYRPNETTGGIFVSWRRKEELPTGA